MLAQALSLTGGPTLQFTDAGDIGSWAVSSVQAVVGAGYMQGFSDGTFRPLAPVTRAQAAAVLALLIDQGAP